MGAFGTVFLYIFGYFFIRFKTKPGLIVRICISSAISIIFAIIAISILSDKDAVENDGGGIVGTINLLLGLLFVVRVIIDAIRLKNIIKQGNLVTIKKPDDKA